MPMRWNWLSALAALALGAGCAPGASLYFATDTSALYRRLEISAAAAQGPVPLLLRGNPFPDVAPDRLAAATRAAMTAAPALHPVRLVSGDPGPRMVDHRFIVAFGEPLVGFDSLCADPDAPFTAPQPVAATAAFCIGPRMVSTARGRMLDTVRAPEDPAFSAFLVGLTQALLPPVNPRLPRCGLVWGMC